ncbi:MAG: hypothetical protein PHY10_02565, partial [Patescibacteria group bacterium]|nr:hypothetical protein [Patescibacteria group bacterium]
MKKLALFATYSVLTWGCIFTTTHKPLPGLIGILLYAVLVLYFDVEDRRWWARNHTRTQSTAPNFDVITGYSWLMVGAVS